MLNLVGKNLSVTAPVTALKKMGHIDGSDGIQEFFEKLLARVENSMTDEQKQQMAEYKPYLANSPILPIIVTNMIEQDLNFTDSLKASKFEITMSCIQMKAVFGMMSIIPGATEMFETVIEEIIDALSDMNTQNSTPSDITVFSCPIKEMSTEFCAGLEKLGITALGEKISNMEKVTTAIRVNMIDPVFDSIINAILKEDNITEDEMDADDKAAIQQAIKSTAEDAAITFPVQTIFSTVLAKAIEDDITMAEAMATFDADQLVESTVEKIVFSENLAKYAEQLERAMAIAYRLA